MKYNERDVFRKRVINELVNIIEKYLGKHTFSYGITEEEVFMFANEILDDTLNFDIERLVMSDPAVQAVADSYLYAFESYKGITAVMYYRIANKLIYDNWLISDDDDEDDYRDVFDEGINDTEDKANFFVKLARKISEDAAVSTTIEINPKARIGKGLVIDHGVNVQIAKETYDETIHVSTTVIGETCIIGENCCILNGVILGASSVNTGENDPRRHPKVGSDVTICSGVRILGNITIGNNVFISPNCVITRDIPDNCNVTIITEVQIEKIAKYKTEGGYQSSYRNDIKIEKRMQGQVVPDESITIYGLVPIYNQLELHGENLQNAKLSIVERNHTIITSIKLDIIEQTVNCIRFALKIENISEIQKRSASILIEGDYQCIYIYSPLALKKIINNIAIEV